MPAMIECSATEAKRRDARLNAAYKSAMNRVANKTDLRNKQRVWIKARDKACKRCEEYDNPDDCPDIEDDNFIGGGQAGWLNHYGCVSEKTSQRVTELEAMK